jgi:hypothetical protein
MSDENKNLSSLERSLLERIEMLEEQVIFYNRQSTSESFGKRVISLVSRIFCRENLELFLSIAALAISISTAVFILYF